MHGLHGVPTVAQHITKLIHNIHEDAGLNPGLTQWVGDPAVAMT